MELKELEKKNKQEANRLNELDRERRKSVHALKLQREELQRLEKQLEKETDASKKTRMNGKINRILTRNKSAEKKVKRMEEDYKRSMEEHQKFLKMEEQRRSEMLRARRKELKSRRDKGSRPRVMSR